MSVHPQLTGMVTARSIDDAAEQAAKIAKDFYGEHIEFQVTLDDAVSESYYMNSGEVLTTMFHVWFRATPQLNLSRKQ